MASEQTVGEPGTKAVAAAVVLLNYNGWKDTLACLDSLLSSERGVGLVVICDNASTDGSWQHLVQGVEQRLSWITATWQQWWGKGCQPVQQLSRDQVVAGARPDAAVVLIDNQGNWGFARGNNVGLTLALRDPALRFFWLLNNDTEVPPTTVGRLADACERRPDVGLWGGTVAYHDHPDLVQALAGGALNRRTAETRHIGAFMKVQDITFSPGLAEKVEAEMDYALGACMWATRPWMEQVGLLGEHYFLYYEEIDWALRGKRFFKLGYEPQALVLHKEGASIGTAPSGGSPLSVFHLVRSRMIFARLHLPGSHLPGVLAKTAWQAVKYLLKGRVSLASATWRGALDGLGTR